MSRNIAAAASNQMEIWGDEAGNLDFDATGSTYFVVASIVTPGDGVLANDLLALRRTLATKGFALPDGFHATEDAQAVRDEVIGLLASESIVANATIYRKDQVYARIRARPDFVDYFYKLVWFYHLRYVLPRVVPTGVRPFIVTATMSPKKRRVLQAKAVRDVVDQSLPMARAHCAHWSAPSHPCLQAADYYTWAVGVRYERGETRPFDALNHQFRNVYRLF